MVIIARITMSEKAYFKNSIDPNKQKQDIMFNQFKVIYHPLKKNKTNKQSHRMRNKLKYVC